VQKNQNITSGNLFTFATVEDCSLLFCDWLSPISPNAISPNPEKYIVWANAVVLWKKLYSVSSITFLAGTLCYCNSEPSQHS